ncbi:FAD-binding molybdopterin dehydrogenase [Chitinophagaceae bacterium IBVUCB2]|nr:FAD-binding molybdopterin dehydrogenase [Chitinophagaceae bacterium IBVUCB2]
MINFEYTRVNSAKAAVAAKSKNVAAQFIAGGTNLVDLMKKGVTAPQRLIDINALPLKDISSDAKGLSIGTLVPNSVAAENKLVLEKYPLLAMALNAGASAQLRNMATVGGNIMQRTRCPYFYDITMPCNKRIPQSGCGAMEGYNRMHAIFGASDKCIAVHPSDMCVALAALNATVVISGTKGEKKIPFANFHRLPGDTPELDNNLQTGELITAVHIPANRFNRSYYLKVRDRLSYAFALVSVAVALEVTDGSIRSASIAMGGVAHKPWRLTEVEKYLIGKSITANVFKEAAEIGMKNAKTYQHNQFKVKMGKSAIVEALTKATS